MPPSVKVRYKGSDLYQRIYQIIENARGNIVRAVIDLFFTNDKSPRIIGTYDWRFIIFID